MFLKNKGHTVSIIDIPNKEGWGIKEFLKKNEKIEYRVEDARSMSWEDETFDRVYCISVLEHMDNREEVMKAISEIWRVLKKGGLAAITYDSYLKEFPNLKGLSLKKVMNVLRFKSYKEDMIKKSRIRDKNILFASEGKIINQDVKLGNLFCFTKRLKKYSNIYVPVGVVLQK